MRVETRRKKESRSKSGGTPTSLAACHKGVDRERARASESGAIRVSELCARISKISMLIDERRQRQHSPTSDERLPYGDTNPNLRHNIQFIPPPSHAPCGGGDRPPVAFGAVLAPLALAIAAAALRRRIPCTHSRTHSHSHMLIGTCQAAQPLFGCRAARSRFFTPSPLTSA